MSIPNAESDELGKNSSVNFGSFSKIEKKHMKLKLIKKDPYKRNLHPIHMFLKFWLYATIADQSYPPMRR